MTTKNLIILFFIILSPLPCQAQRPLKKGKFVGTVNSEWLNDGRLMKLTKPFAYVDRLDYKWQVPTGTLVDGASIPKSLWSIMGGPFEGQYRNASVVHDYYCITKRRNWEDVHKMFYEACIDGGVNSIEAKVMFAAVYLYGPRWRPGRIACTDCKPQVFLENYSIEVPDSINKETVQWINATDPSIDEIQTWLDSRVDDPDRALTRENERLESILKKEKEKSPQEYEALQEKIKNFTLKNLSIFMTEEYTEKLRRFNDELEAK